MTHKTESQQNQDAIEFAENYNKKVAPSLKTKMLHILGAAAITAGGLFGLGKAGENDFHADEMSNKNTEQIMEDVQKGGEITQEMEIPEKGGDGGTYTNSEGRQIQIIVGPDGKEVHVDMATGEAIAELSSKTLSDDLPFIPGNDGDASVATEREANESADR